VLLLLVLICSACNSGESVPFTQHPGTSVETYAAPDPGSETPALAGLPAPSELRNVSWDPGDQLIYGSLLADFWPHAGVTADPPWAEYSSQYQHQPSPTFDDVAFALYRFKVLPGTGPVLGTDWETPPGALGCYIGLANYTTDSWNWFACTGDDISLPPLAPYIVDDLVTLAVCVLEVGPLRLQCIRFGPDLPPEARLNVDSGYTHAGEAVEFSLASSEDPERDIALYEIDFDGDGTFEYSSPDTPTTDYTYMLAGTFNAIGRVTDGAGLTALDEMTMYVSGFVPQLVDATGFSPSIAVDPVSDTPKISYSGGENYTDLCVATLNDPVDISTLYTMVEQNMHTALLLTPTTMEIAFGGAQLHYAVRGEFNDGTLVDADKGGGKPAIATDGEGVTSIFYSHLEGEFPVQTAHFTRAYGDYSHFDLEQLDASEPTGQYCDAAYEGYLAAAYTTNAGGSPGEDLYLGIYNTIDGWSWSTVATDVRPSKRILALEINPGDHQPCLAYISDPSGESWDYTTTYTWYADDAWQTEWLENYTFFCDLALDGAGNPHIICAVHHVAPERFALWYHWYDGAEWQRQFAEQTPEGTVEFLELALDSADRAHISWTFIPDGETVSQLWYASNEP
jgi:hypothetical protein